MLSTLQPSRPKTQLSPQYPNPQFQQQSQASHSQSTSSAPAPSPRSQVEAMPPNKTPMLPVAAPQPMYNPALVHPVFFMNGWRKPPFPVPVNAAFSPVAAGYVFGNGRTRADSMTKL